ncbi:3-methyladenine DNA glycosylase/8-oxoguanine DNA glycosylase [Pandoraea horticolens]|uniref:DNA-3-methyladenine glycosylase II n=1 Tax=Pandoraea horticolens TaxID=2508298 RepID=A0A5E4T039_9BURK|nr:endonuclease III domain-containing protein [Pandoraea horticolens]VVD81165.1 3-methyladenine DNA glycosylase/8-oxoguanine DNA glycosylase [Pandoraea horticolens]
MVTRKSVAAKVATKTAAAKTAQKATKAVKSATAGESARRTPAKAAVGKPAAVKTGRKTAAGKTTEKAAKTSVARKAAQPAASKVAQKAVPKSAGKVARKAPAKSAPATSHRLIAKRDGETRIVTPEIARIDHDVIEQVVTGVVPLPVASGATRPGFWDQACADLMKRDRILKKLIPQFGPAHLTGRGEPFVTLARSIVGQQISVKAAQAVWDRVVAVCPKLTPAQFIKAGHDALAGCGLSRRKAEYILDLATHFKSGVLHVDAWASMDDEAVIAELTGIRGIGRWTAEMFLMFNLMRPDVLPLDDVGLINAISVNYFSGEPVTRSEAREVAANWEPWRSVATWYMWRSLEPVPVEY